MRKILLAFVATGIYSLSVAVPINETSNQGYYTAAAPNDCAPVVVTLDQIVAFPGAVYVIYHWGDGTPSSGPLSLAATPTHTYSNAGTQDIWCEYLNGSGFNVGWENNRIE